MPARPTIGARRTTRRERRGSWIVRLSTGALVGAIALSCASSGVNRGDLNLVSIEEEWRLGAQLERDLAGKLDLVEKGRASAYLDRVGKAIVYQTELRDLPWTFHLVNDPTLNAFNIPGGHVYVHTGLVEAAPDAAAFVGVLAHEIGHGVARHGTEQLTKQYGVSVIAGALLGRDPALYQQILAQVISTGAIASFSRDDEREADSLGVRYSHDAGYDSTGLSRMLEVLQAQAQRSPDKVQSFFATHPASGSRIEDTRRLAADLEGGRRDDSGFGDFQRVAARSR